MSTQPLFDTGQLRRNQMRFAMAVGDNRHYRVYDILPRHVAQTVAKAGMHQATIPDIVEELRSQMPLVIDTVCNALPADFPQALRDSITGGIEARLQRLTTG